MTEHDQSDDELDLQSALSGLTRIALGAQPLSASLERVAALAAQAIPSADGAGLAMLEEGRQQTIVVSAPFVQAVDEAQYGLGEGPCITAAAEARTVKSGALGQDPSWPAFGPQAAALGVHSSLSLPLMVGDEVLGALNVYAYRGDAFTDDAAAIGESFAASASVAVHNARVLMQAQRVAGQLQAALGNRATIDQAIGILMSRRGFTADEAFALLREMSQSGNLKLATIAQRIVHEAVSRARARRVPGSDS